MDDFYVYIHRRVTDNKVFYVGKGKGQRAWSNRSRNKFWERTVSKHGKTVEIVYDALSEQEAFTKEQLLIEQLKPDNPLTNLTEGGEGCSGFKWSEEQIKNHVFSKMKGIKRTPEQIEKNRKAQTGKKQSSETKLKRSASIRSKGCRDKNTYLFYSKDDVFIGTRSEFVDYVKFDSLRDIRTLFWDKYQLVCKGWSVLRPLELLIFKEIKCP